MLLSSSLPTMFLVRDYTRLHLIKLKTYQLPLRSICRHLLTRLSDFSCTLKHLKLLLLKSLIILVSLGLLLHGNRISFILELHLIFILDPHLLLKPALVLRLDHAYLLRLKPCLINLLEHLVFDLAEFADTILDQLCIVIELVLLLVQVRPCGRVIGQSKDVPAMS